MLISIEGNIGSGKSTIVNYLKTLNKNIIFVDEPVDEWLQIKDKAGNNALECFYQDKQKNAFCFQILAYITRLKKLMEHINSDNIIITERSIETDRNVFAKMLYEDGFLSSIEWETYNYWFDTFKNASKVNLIIYIKTSPDKCMERINIRNRTEESNIQYEYLEKCDKYHNDWLLENNNIKIIDGHDTINNIREKVINILNKLLLENNMISL
jgi:deoxyadenosine/deoxycytidine kinase